jgi:hypothetical protein
VSSLKETYWGPTIYCKKKQKKIESKNKDTTKKCIVYEAIKI